MADGKAQIVLSAVDKTGPAFQTALRNMASLKSEALSIVGRFTAIGAGLTALVASVGTFGIKGVIDTADELGKLSQRTGIAIEDLSALKLAAELSDVSLDELGGALKRFNQNIAAAARGQQEQAAAFKAIGVAVVDSTGKVRSADKVLADVADRFESYADGANKVALANAIGGKSFESLIPLLNGGSKGLKDAADEAKKLGVVFGPELSKKAEEFNDNLTKIAAASEGLKVQLTSGLIDRLAKLSEEFLNAAKNGGIFKAVLSQLGEVLSGKATWTLAFGGPDLGAEVKKAEGDVARLTALRDKLRDEGKDPERTQRIGSQLEQAEARLKQLGGGVKVDKSIAQEGDRGGRGITTDKPDAPAVPDPAAADRAAAEALATLNKLTEGRVKRAQDAANEEQDIARHREQILRGIYELGESSLSDFYAKQDDLRRQNLAATKKAINDEIKAREDQLASPLLQGKDKQSEREDIKNKITEAKGKLGDADREFQQADEASTVERRRATRELLEQVTEIDVRIKALAGDDAGAAMLENAKQVVEARRLLQQAGGDPAKADQLASALDLQTRFNQAQKDFGLLSQQASNAEERLLIAARQNGKGLLATEDELHGLRQSALAQLGELIAKTEAFAAASKDPTVLQYLDDLKLRYEQLAEVQDPRKVRFDAAADEIGSSVAGAVDPKNFNAIRDQEAQRIAEGVQRERDAFDKRLDQLHQYLRDADTAQEKARLRQQIRETEAQKDSVKSASATVAALKKVLGGIADDIGSIVTKELVTKPLAESISNFVKGAGGQGAGENLLGLFSGGSKKALPKEGDANFVGPLPEGVTAKAAEPSIVDRVKQFFGFGPKQDDVLRNTTGIAGGNAKSILGADAGKPSPLFSPQGASASLETLRQASDAAAQALQRIANTQPGSATPGEQTTLPTGDFARADREPPAGGDLQPALEGTADSAAKTTDQVNGLGLGAQVATQLLGNLGKESTAASVALSILPTIIQSMQGTGGGSSGGGGDLFGQLVGMYLDDFASVPIFHAGGVVGEGTAARKVNLSALPRYHTGGIAGMQADAAAALRPSEKLAVLLKNEEVLTRDDPRHRDNLPSQVFERIQSMKEGASLSSLAGFDMSGIEAAKVAPSTLPDATAPVAQTPAGAQVARLLSLGAKELAAPAPAATVAPALPVVPGAARPSVAARPLDASRVVDQNATAVSDKLAAPLSVLVETIAAEPRAIVPTAAEHASPAVLGTPSALLAAVQGVARAEPAAIVPAAAQAAPAAAAMPGAPGAAGAAGAAGAPAVASAFAAAAQAAAVPGATTTSAAPATVGATTLPTALAVLDALTVKSSREDTSLLQRFDSHVSTSDIERNSNSTLEKLIESTNRYHTGGIAGLKADNPPGLKANETLAVLLKNEEVLTHDDPRHRNNLPDKVFERVMAMKEGAALSSLSGFDVRGVEPSKLLQTTDRSTDTSTNTSTDSKTAATSNTTIERQALHERLLQRFDSSELRQLESVTHGQLDKVLESTSVWDEVERYHTGGIAGLKADEVPAVLRRGEEVLTQADSRHRDNAGNGSRESRPVNVTVNVPPGTTRPSAEQTAALTGREVSRAVRRGTAGTTGRTG